MIAPIRGFSKGHRILVRPYRQSDRDHLRSAIREVGEKFLGRGSRNWEESFAFQRGLTWTAELDNRPVGFAGTEDYQNGVMLFHSDIVHPSGQRCGAGTALTLARIATTQPDDILYLALLSTEYSRSFYERFGFKPEGEPTKDQFFGLTFSQMTVPFGEGLQSQAKDLLQVEGVDFQVDHDGDEPAENP